MQIIEALALYLQQLAADGRSEHTRKQAQRHVRLFASWMVEAEIEAVRHEDVARFLASATVAKRADGAPRKPTSANALRSSLRCFFSFVHAAGYTSANAARLVRRARCGPSKPKALSEADQQKLLAALEQARTCAERRDRALFILLLRAGLRIGSAVSLDVADLDLEVGEVQIRKLKNGGSDSAFLPPDAVEVLRDHIGTRSTGPLFPSALGKRLTTRSAHRRLAMWGRRAAIERVFGPHALRHCFALSLYHRTGDVLLVGRALSHRSIASTMVYAQPSRERVRMAVTGT